MTTNHRLTGGSCFSWCCDPSQQSESLHREAYNAVFREFGVDYNWSPEYYDVLQNTVSAALIPSRSLIFLALELGRDRKWALATTTQMVIGQETLFSE